MDEIVTTQKNSVNLLLQPVRMQTGQSIQTRARSISNTPAVRNAARQIHNERPAFTAMDTNRPFMYAGQGFTSLYQCVMAQMARTFGHFDIAEQIRQTPDTGRQIQLTMDLSRFNPQHWQNVKRGIWLNTLLAQCQQHPVMFAKLLTAENNPLPPPWGPDDFYQAVASLRTEYEVNPGALRRVR